MIKLLAPVSKKLMLLSLTSILFGLSGCPIIDPIPTFPAGKVDGLKPVYLSSEKAYDIRLLAPRPLEYPGKIYVMGSYLFINDLHKGIHIIDNEDPEAPKPMYFIQIYGNVDLAIKDNFLYADNINDLIVLDISSPANFSVTKRIKNVFPGVSEYPFETGAYFECPDPDKGIVVGWEKAVLTDPECYR